MLTLTEFEIVVSGERIISEVNLPNGKYKMIIETAIPAKEHCGEFVRVPVSELSLNDDWFKKCDPTKLVHSSDYQLVEEIIKSGMKDFYCPKYDPSFNKDGNGICYVPGKQPAIGKSYKWWKKIAEGFAPEYKISLGTKYKWKAFMAVFVKKLVKSGWEVNDAWNAIFNDSKELLKFPHCDRSDKKFVIEQDIEDTGSRGLFDFFDLCSTEKFLLKDDDDICIASSNIKSELYTYYLCFSPSGKTSPVCCSENTPEPFTGWITLDKEPK